MGTLVGFNVLSNTFVFATPLGDHYSGRLAERFPKSERIVPYQYRAHILQKKVTTFATEAVQTTYELLDLTDAA